jgi:DNA-binding MarR family transcriptional regulator
LRAYRAYADLLDAGDSLRKDLTAQLGFFDLTVEGFRILEMLYSEGTMTVAAVCVRRRCQRQTLMFSTDRLRKRGWLEYEVTELAPVGTRASKAPMDRRGGVERGKRVATLRLSEKGENFMREVFPRHTKLVFALMMGLDARQQDLLSKLCRKVIEGNVVKLLREIRIDDV